MQQQHTLLITGGSSGIGQAVVRLALERGWTVFAWSRSMDAVSAEFDGLGGTLHPKNVDVGDADALALAAEELVASHGVPDCVVNNAGVGDFAAIEELSLEQFDSMINVNLRAPWLLSRSLMPHMKARGSGIFAQLNSVASTDVFPGCTAYAASKMGLLGVSRSMRAEVRDHGVKVLDFVVGATKSHIWDAEFLEERGSEMMETETIGKAIMQALEFGLMHPDAMIEEIHVKPQGGNL